MSPTAKYQGPVRVGTIRPSQAIHSYGVGALIDLPSLSVMIGGLDRWDTTRQAVITEDRLLDAVRTRLGPQVESLLALPVEPQTTNNPYDEWARIGLPVTVFPRWLRCTACNRLFPVASGALKLDHNPHRIDRTRYTHPNCDRARRPPPAVPARFVAGCINGHLDDFPWVRFAHDGVPTCPNPILQVNDIGSGGRATDLLVKCLACGAKSTLAKAFGPAAIGIMPQCRGRHPHLGLASEPCTEQLRTLVLGASNLWFNASVAVLSLPVGGGSLAQLVHDHWAAFDKMPVREVLTYALSSDRILQAAFAGHDMDDIWDAVEAHRAGAKPSRGTDVLGPEWAALTTGSQGHTSPHFEAEPIAAPPEFGNTVAGVTLAHRLRVVTALCGFSRISAGEPGDGRATARLETTGSPTWVPVVENRGEGIFLRLDEEAVQTWEANAVDHQLFVAMRRAHRDWRQIRRLDPTQGWPGERFVLLHSLSHAVINELAIECGYSSASIRERIYSRSPGDGPEPMAGILLYTSAPDAEGTLGGLVNLGQAAELGPILHRALERSGLCSSDPLCADHEPDAATSALHGAACHACLLVAETSCERGNRYLDRSLLADTFRHTGLEYFRVSELTDAIATTVASLGEAHIKALADAYRSAGRFTTAQTAKAKRAVPAPHHREVDRLNVAWATEPDLAGSAIVLALESVQSAHHLADVPVIEIVVTGPDSTATPVRLTSEVVRQLIDRANHRVTLVSYAAYQMPSIIAALDAAAARGVVVSLILESAVNLDGGGGAHAYAKHLSYHWPTDRREPPDAKLHAKAVIVDAQDVLLTSANMTNAAYDKNIELGVLCRGGGVAGQVQRHFDALIARGILQQLSEEVLPQPRGSRPFQD